MGKKLTKMTWDDVQKEMSIAGNPEAMRELGQQIMQLIAEKNDKTNRAELTNVELMLQRIIAEVRLWQRMYDRSH
jgi:hypothetical protein